MKSWKQRLLIPVEPLLIPDDHSEEFSMLRQEKELFAKSGLPLACGYRRVVIGGRGPYVEFHFTDIMWGNFYVPDDQKYRLNDKRVYYDEWRSIGRDNVKLYFQKRTVKYADYRIGMMYISPFDLFIDGKRPIIV